MIPADELKSLDLRLNALKSKYVRFRNGSFLKNAFINIHGTKVDESKSVNYLGISIMYNLCEKEDIKRANSAFLRQFYSFFSKFSGCSLNLKFKLFGIYCTSFYGSSLWTNRKGAIAEFKSSTVTYHKAIKKILGVPYWFSNHDVCNHTQRFTFENLVNLNIFNFLHQINNSISPCLTQIRNYLLYESKFACEANQIARENYSFDNVLNNDMHAISSCILRTQSLYISNIPYERMLGNSHIFSNNSR